MEAAQPIEISPPKPATRERWVSALPMFIFFVLIALGSRIVSHYDEMFRGMELGPTPAITQYLFSLSETIRTMPWIFTTFMFVVAWSYFTWIAGDRTRTVRFNRVLWLLIGLSAAAMLIVLFLPLIGEMEKISKK